MCLQKYPPTADSLKNEMDIANKSDIIEDLFSQFLLYNWKINPSIGLLELYNILQNFFKMKQLSQYRISQWCYYLTSEKIVGKRIFFSDYSLVINQSVGNSLINSCILSFYYVTSGYGRTIVSVLVKIRVSEEHLK